MTGPRLRLQLNLSSKDPAYAALMRCPPDQRRNLAVSLMNVQAMLNTAAPLPTTGPLTSPAGPTPAEPLTGAERNLSSPVAQGTPLASDPAHPPATRRARYQPGAMNRALASIVAGDL